MNYDECFEGLYAGWTQNNSVREGQIDYEYRLAHILERISLAKASACNNFAHVKRYREFKEL